MTMLSSFNEYMLARIFANLFHVSLETGWIIQWVVIIVVAFAIALVVIWVDWKK